MDMQTTTASPVSGTRRDYIFGIVAGLIIGLLILPVLKTAKPSLYDSFAIIIVPLFVVLTPLGLVVASFINRKLSFVWQLSKFAVIGVMNMLVDLGVLAFLSAFAAESAAPIAPEDAWFSLLAFTVTYYSLYKGCSFIVANINSYLWNKNWTFEASANKKVGAEFLEFFLVSVVGFIVNVVIASFVFSAFHSLNSLSTSQWGLIGAVGGSFAGLAWNFIGYKFIVFKKPE